MTRENYFYCNFTKCTPPIGFLKAGGTATNTTLSENNFLLNDVLFAQYVMALDGGGDTTQVLLAPVSTNDGLDVTGDAHNDDGFCYTPCGYLGNSAMGFTIGGPAFFFRCKFSIADVSDVDECLIGFRLASQASTATFADYTDKACLNVNAGSIETITALNNAADVTTTTTDTWLDGATHTLQVNVSAAGVASYLIDGAAPTVVAGTAFTFDAGDIVIPFWRHLHAAASAAGIVWLQMECGYQE